MAVRSGFFNSVNGDRKYDARWFAEYFATFIGNGVFPNPSTGLQVVEGENMQTILKPGKGWINGYFIVNDNDYILQHDLADGVLKRIDRIVMRLNYVTRQIEIEIKKGTFSSAPVAPTLQRDVEIYELALADVLINNGATQITQANITDQRLNTSLCGIVHSTVNQVDTTSIFIQFESWYKQKTKEFESWFEVNAEDMLEAFDVWFAYIKERLEDIDVADLVMELDAFRIANERHLNLISDIKGTKQQMTFNNVGMVTQIEHIQNGVVLRTDTYDYSVPNFIMEQRSLRTGENLTYRYNLNTLEIEVI